MKTRAVPLFLNPTAGRGRAGRRVSRIRELFEHAGILIEVHSSRAVGDLEDQVCAAVANGEGKIIVAGGDGSIHEAVNGIMRASGEAALGVIPTGTGNDFAKACAIPLNWEHATQLLAGRLCANASSRSIDIGRMNDRYFANGAGIGFDAKVTRIARAYRWPIGDFVYLLAIFRCMVDGIATPDLTIETEDLRWSGPITLASISNGAWIGGMFHIAPMANNSDGQLELMIADPVSRLRILFLLPKLLRGTHMGAREITHTGARRLRIAATAPLESHLDGEVQPLAMTFEVEVLPAALDLL
ncbi:MAG: diacylglycerol kinase family lipid kinase [Gammaproteobacteria bacterium]|nr:diacylglycerol kinase family lipid kinase [Gammaproteobacteria bacterium]MDH3373641.1 diacylglycerol kinase family lipid kinase [Gammaproteobacteria bacterium]MDH3410773.1 diacylglycerol kinase family lipid kinase [Gammaproteobacteria bacterium]MDH3552870.1 diacylglycerol kinase family lipid kinase [Gammaproteobacteria bacterium]